ncbi:uncharacterized protein LOC122370632 isoform X2 [Amphibalanus amphitrite]|nr:uncharacterized protein LOC122370632 isoform X2 [Amphibalanus amphitrite]
MVGGKLLLKSEAVPHKFACQPKRIKDSRERTTSVRRSQATQLEAALALDDEDASPADTAEPVEDPEVPALPSRKAVGCQTETTTTTSASQTDMSSSALEGPSTLRAEESGDDSSSNQDITDVQDKDFEVDSGGDETDADLEFDYEHFVRDRIRKLCKKDPKRYIGVPAGYLKVIEILARDHIEPEHGGGSKLTAFDVCLLVLMKIKQNKSFDLIADDFGISRSYASRLFAKHLPFIASAMRELVYWPKTEAIRQALPLAFKARFARTTCIIDCMEIQVEKPSGSFKQSMTYSSYKSCNTAKYLLSITPNGFVNFISKGCGGRSSDMAILETSGFMDNLEPGMIVMADRGFKSLEPLLAQKGCTLVRPSSVSSSSVMTKKEVKWSKQIASLRIHVERAIRRVREFELLRPNACIEHQLWSLLDECVLTVCALTNLQPPLIRV